MKRSWVKELLWNPEGRHLQMTVEKLFKIRIKEIILGKENGKKIFLMSK